METPSSISRVAMSQATHTSENKKQHEVHEKSLSSQSRTRMGRRPERPVLLDITNDSPIVGLAAGSMKTPSSSVGKSRARAAGRGTPGSGEALLRGQVKTLLQKVDEDAELVRVPSDEAAAAAAAAAPFQALLGHLRSPAGLLAPTPANTPQIFSLPGNKDGPVSEIIPSAQKDGDSKVTLVAAVLKEQVLEQETPDLRQCVINRALQFDSAEDSEFSGSPMSSSAVTYQGSDFSSCTKKPMDDDCSSAWSTQTNPSWREDEEEEEEEEEEDCGADDGYLEGGEEEEGAEAEGLDALCEDMRRMSMDQKMGLPDFAGKHTRFTYNSDDEIVGDEEVGGVSPGVLRLRGLPVPSGKHLRFQEEEED
ncbi:hypothetical protein Taro_008793 [Colocasia esculenta]|uniref:Uncharacterized protein n=1 Tax=Colocasia esculenta TaxID=4460 RepID=A0A843U4G7_COLES|nr:hypothetical protein [Colocasia esculenta]